MLDIFRALADPTRLRIVQLLRTMELSVGELAQVLAQSQPRVSRHIKILCDAGVAERRKEGSWVFIGPGANETTGPLFVAFDAWFEAQGEDHWHVADAARLSQLECMCQLCVRLAGLPPCRAEQRLKGEQFNFMQPVVCLLDERSGLGAFPLRAPRRCSDGAEPPGDRPGCWTSARPRAA